jgi:phage FluMu protein Com
MSVFTCEVLDQKFHTIQDLLQTRSEKIKELRGYLAESVCIECKCPQNTEVNMTAIKDNLTLKERLASAEKALGNIKEHQEINIFHPKDYIKSAVWFIVNEHFKKYEGEK